VPDLNLPLLLGGAAMTVFLGGLAAAETALQEVGPHRLRKLSGNGNGDSDDHAAELQQLNHVLTFILALRIVLLVGFGGLATHWAWALVPGWQAVTAALAVGGLVLMIVEIIGRQTAITYSDSVAAGVWKPLVSLSRVLYPFVLIPLWLARPFVPAKGRTTQLASVHLEEIHEEIQRLHVEGVIEHDESQIIQSVFEFGETIAKEVMVPRVDMICVQLGSPLNQVLELMINCGYTRLPVYAENVDEILGLVNAKDLLKQVDELKDGVITRERLREILFVPGTKKIPKVLRDLQRNRITMAIVVDEYGGTDGLLTLEDIVEEIVGEITDEYDQASEGVQMLKDGSAIVDAKMVLEDVNSYVGLDLPVDEHETLGGYVYGLFGRVPRALETFEVDGLRLTVESVQRQRITRVRIQKLEAEERTTETKDSEVAAAST